MYCTRKITDSITWVGGNDRRLALFENLFPIPRGVSYNSYLIMDEKTVLVDTADASITRQFLENITHTLSGRGLDYLIVNHMEPDHCANIEELLLRYPDLKIVGNSKTLSMIGQFYDLNAGERSIVVKENDTLPLGQHTLRFYFAPMVHWPEVMMTYEESEQLLFSADAFGTFGALNGNLFNDEVNFERDWLPDARRYYSNIVGKYGAQVQSALKKVAGLPIRMICPLHGLVWRSDIDVLLDKYAHWSQYQPEERAVALFYGSMYGDTENAVNVLAAGLAEAGVKNIAVYDISSTHVSVLISEILQPPGAGSSHLQRRRLPGHAEPAPRYEGPERAEPHRSPDRKRLLGLHLRQTDAGRPGGNEADADSGCHRDLEIHAEGGFRGGAGAAEGEYPDLSGTVTAKNSPTASDGPHTEARHTAGTWETMCRLSFTPCTRRPPSPVRPIRPEKTAQSFTKKYSPMQPTAPNG